MHGNKKRQPPLQSNLSSRIPALCGSYQPTLQQFCPRYPIIKADAVHPDIPYALNRLSETAYEKETDVLQHSYTQIILARAMPHFSFTEKSSVGSNDMIYRTVAYIAGHFTEEITLSGMAKALGYSPARFPAYFPKHFTPISTAISTMSALITYAICSVTRTRASQKPMKTPVFPASVPLTAFSRSASA
nr:hypothetical protein [uncultured Marvinbryantia sp.]